MNLDSPGLPFRAAPADEHASSPAIPTLVIEPGSRWGIDLRELWRYRELFGFLVWRDIRIRYAQTVLGAGWAILQPVLTMLVFMVIFERFAGIEAEDGVPYAAWSLAALVPWTYFSTALTNSSSSLVTSANLITKIYFPRLVIPFSPVLAGLVDYAIAFVVLLAVMIGYGIAPGLLALVVVPFSVVIAAMAAAGIGSWLAALNLQYRDVKYVVPFLVQVWMYSSTIIYPLKIWPENIWPIVALNPLIGVIEGMRAALLGTRAVPWSLMLISFAAAAVLFVSGSLYFRRTERIFADVV